MNTRRRRPTILLLLLAGLLAASCGVSDAQRTPLPPEPEWSYTGLTGPDHWATLWPPWATCDSSQRQSPVDLVNAQSDPSLPVIALTDYHANPVDLLNTGHGIEQAWYAGSTLSFGGATYELQQVHFHTGSEHTVGGVASAMEIHFVHRNTLGYDLLVIGVLVDATGVVPNPFLALFEDNLPAAKGNVVVNNNYLDPTQAEMLGTALTDYYVYDGSLTTPSCSPIVTWIVPKTPRQATAAQIAKFSAIMGANVRPPQPIHSRVIRQRP